jgi:hypothetical protein
MNPLSDQEFVELAGHVAKARDEVRRLSDGAFIRNATPEATMALALAEARRDDLAWRLAQEAKRRVVAENKATEG